MWTVMSDYSALKKGLSTKKPRRGALQHNIIFVELDPLKIRFL